LIQAENLAYTLLKSNGGGMGPRRKILIISRWCAHQRGLGEIPDPATHTHRRSHPRDQCWIEHRGYISDEVNGCAIHNGVEDNQGRWDPATETWTVPPCEFCRRERATRKAILSIAHARKLP
jgi:hypothetical protein